MLRTSDAPAGSTPALEAALEEHIARGEMAGAVTVAWRPGQPTRRLAIGRRDVARDLPVAHDTLFRIASLTKPVTSVGALTLFDEGRFALDDPITRVVPELEDLRVLQDPEGPLENTVYTDWYSGRPPYAVTPVQV